MISPWNEWRWRDLSPELGGILRLRDEKLGMRRNEIEKWPVNWA